MPTSTHWCCCPEIFHVLPRIVLASQNLNSRYDNCLLSLMATTTITKHLPLGTHRYALIVSYIGTRYKGSQRLTSRSDSTTNNEETIQEALEAALRLNLPERCARLTGASRTDRGVHATMNMYTMPIQDFTRSTKEMKISLNRHLIRKHHQIVVNDVILMKSEFDPRSSIARREYIYKLAVLDDDSIRSHLIKKKPYGLTHLLPATLAHGVMPIPQLNIEKAQEAIDILKGEHDFASFARSYGEYEKDTVRDLAIDITLDESKLTHFGILYPFKLYHIKLQSKSFLYNQVRRLLGAILGYATHDIISLGKIRSLLEKPSASNWPASIEMAEPSGLYLNRFFFAPESVEGSYRTDVNGEQEPAEGSFNKLASTDD